MFSAAAAMRKMTRFLLSFGDIKHNEAIYIPWSLFTRATFTKEMCTLQSSWLKKFSSVCIKMPFWNECNKNEGKVLLVFFK